MHTWCRKRVTCPNNLEGVDRGVIGVYDGDVMKMIRWFNDDDDDDGDDDDDDDDDGDDDDEDDNDDGDGGDDD